MRRVKYTLGIMHWAQDESRWSWILSLTGIADATEYKALLGIALDHATLRKVNRGTQVGSWAREGWYLPGDGTYVYLPRFTLQGTSQTIIPRVWVPKVEPEEKALLWPSASGNGWALICCAQLVWLIRGWQGGHTGRRSYSKRECGLHKFFCGSGPCCQQGYPEIPDQGPDIC